jgi:hypothetical protein
MRKFTLSASVVLIFSACGTEIGSSSDAGAAAICSGSAVPRGYGAFCGEDGHTIYQCSYSGDDGIFKDRCAEPKKCVSGAACCQGTGNDCANAPVACCK